MTRVSRRIIFYLLIAAFIIAGPFLVAYSMGYSLNVNTGTLEKTGGIFIKATTPQVSLFLDNNLARETNFLSAGAFLTEIPPGTHLLRVEKAGYIPWSKTLEVAPQVVTEFKNIVLVPSSVARATTTKEELALINLVIGNVAAGTHVESRTIRETASSAQPVVRRDAKQNLVVQDQTSTHIVARNVHSFAERDGTVFFIDQNGFLDRYDQSDGTTRILGHPGFYLTKQPCRFIASPTGEMAILDSAGGLFLLDANDQLHTVTGNVDNLSFTPNGRKALLVRNDRVEVWWRADNTSQPFQKKGTREEILALEPDSVLGARWYYEDTDHIFVRTPSGISFTETDSRGRRNTTELVTGRTDEMLTIPDLPKAVLYRKGAAWFKIEW